MNDKRIIMIEGAMNMETEHLIASLEHSQEYMLGNWRFVSGQYQGTSLVVAVTSIGMSNAAAATALGIERFHPTAIISQGTAGGHNPALKAYDIVLGRESFDASAYRTAREDEADWKHMELAGSYAYNPIDGTFIPQAVYFPGDKDLLEVAHAASEAYTHGRIVDGCIASCNTWNRQKERIQYLHSTFHSSCEDMEVASAALISHQYGIPFLGIRIISNTEFDNEEFQPETAHICQQFVLDIITNLSL